jgi:hypothetical protein
MVFRMAGAKDIPFKELEVYRVFTSNHTGKG